MPSFSTLRFTHVHPWGVEPQSLEPETHVLFNVTTRFFGCLPKQGHLF